MAIRHITEDGRSLPARRADIPSDPDALKNWAEALVAQARADGVQLTGSEGLLTGLVREVLQAGLEVEMNEHLGYESGDPAGRNSGNSRNGHYPKTVGTEIGEVTLKVPRDRKGEFNPATVPKFARRMDGLAGNVISLYSRGMTTGEIQGHLSEMYGSDVSRETISKITDAVVEDLTVWQNRPLDKVYPVEPSSGSTCSPS